MNTELITRKLKKYLDTHTPEQLAEHLREIGVEVVDITDTNAYAPTSVKSAEDVLAAEMDLAKTIYTTMYKGCDWDNDAWPAEQDDCLRVTRVLLTMQSTTPTPQVDWDKVEIAIGDMPGISMVQAWEIVKIVKQHIAPIDEEHKKITGFNTIAESIAYDKGREDEQKVTVDFIKNWDGSDNSQIGSLIKQHIGGVDRVIDEKTYQKQVWHLRGSLRYLLKIIDTASGKDEIQIHHAYANAKKYVDETFASFTAPANEEVDWGKARDEAEEAAISWERDKGGHYDQVLQHLEDNYTLTRKNTKQ